MRLAPIPSTIWSESRAARRTGGSATAVARDGAEFVVCTGPSLRGSLFRCRGASCHLPDRVATDMESGLPGVRTGSRGPRGVGPLEAVERSSMFIELYMLQSRNV